MPQTQKRLLLQNLESAFAHHERLWEESKAAAVAAVSSGAATRITELRHKLASSEARVSATATFFESVVADLLDRAHRDPKTQLVHSGHFLDQLEIFLSLEQWKGWCAVGLIDIRAFKAHNDTLGHLVGDQILQTVASLISEQIRCEDLIAQEHGRGDLHARFGGDEFCFLVPRLERPDIAAAIAERFRLAVESFDWAAIDEGLRTRPVHVDVGVASLLLGPVSERRARGQDLARELVRRADQLMYEVKAAQAMRAAHCALRIERGRLVEFESNPSR